jgi:hypothetical protein
MPTARAICQQALEALNIVAPTNPARAEDIDTAFRELRGILDLWRLETDIAIQDIATSLPLVPNQANYSVGPTGDFLIDLRPDTIEAAYITDANNQRYPLRLVNGKDFYQSSLDGTATTTYPQFIRYDAQWPDAQLEIYPKPSSAVTLTLVHKGSVVVPTATSTVLDLSPGYEMAIVYTLASNLMIYYQMDNPQITATALAYQSRIKRRKTSPPPLNKGRLGSLNSRYSSGNGTGGQYNVMGDRTI